MGEAYPELITNKKHISKVIKQEEARFSETLASGMSILNQALKMKSQKCYQVMLFLNFTILMDFLSI
jgi:alanyl-tRNA synthetase